MSSLISKSVVSQILTGIKFTNDGIKLSPKKYTIDCIEASFIRKNFSKNSTIVNKLVKNKLITLKNKKNRFAR